MDDILAKKNRHLFLEEKDNVGNSFIANVNNIVDDLDNIDAVANDLGRIDTVADNIDNVNTVAENIDDINTTVENLDKIDQFNDNLVGLLESLLEQLGEDGNAWLVRLTELGESILATTSAFNYAVTTTLIQDIESGATLTLPDAMKYRVGTHMLMVSWNGTVCYIGNQYSEIGEFGEWSTSISMNVPLKTGDKIQFRVVALADAAAFIGQIDSVIGNTSVVATGSTENRTLADRFADIINVKDYGAIGDGTTNDTTAFQNAIATGKAVFVPEGSYKLTTDLTGDFCSTGNSIFIGGTVNGSAILRGTAQRNSDIVNVKNYGAVGDGVTNDEAAFAAASYAGDTIFVPSGTYLLENEPEYDSSKNIVLFSTSDDIHFTGTYGAEKIGDSSRGLIFRQIKTSDENNGRHLISLYQNFTNDTIETTGVRSALYSVTNVEDGYSHKVYGITSSVRTNATSGTSEAVGGYFQGWRQEEDSGTATWGAVAEASDHTDKGNSSGLVGIEVDCTSNGDCSSTTYNRVAVDIRLGSYNHNSTYLDENNIEHKNVMGYGVRVVGVRSLNDIATDPLMCTAKIHSAFSAQGEYDHAFSINYLNRFYDSVIDLTQCNFAENTDKIAVHLRDTNCIAFSRTASNGPVLFATSDSAHTLTVKYGNKNQFVVNSNGIGSRAIYLYDYTEDGEGNETQTSSTKITGIHETGSHSATFSASNKPGSSDVTSPSHWLKVLINNNTFWLPLFSN